MIDRWLAFAAVEPEAFRAASGAARSEHSPGGLRAAADVAKQMASQF